MSCFDCSLSVPLYRCSCDIARCFSCLMAFCHVFEIKNMMKYCCSQCCAHTNKKGNVCVSIETGCMYQLHPGESRLCSTVHGKSHLVMDTERRRRRIVPLCDFHKAHFGSSAKNSTSRRCLNKGIYDFSGHSGESLFYCLRHHQAFLTKETSKVCSGIWILHTWSLRINVSCKEGQEKNILSFYSFDKTFFDKVVFHF